MITDSAKQACVFCNGQLKKPANVKQIANDCDFLIVADGEIKAAAKGKFYDQPDLVDVLGPFP